MSIKKIRMRPEGGNDYADVLHPETSADQVIMNSGETVENTIEMHKADDAKHIPSNGTLKNILKAHPNTSHTIAQVRNMILSPNDGDVSLMGEGDIWIKYK